MAERAHAVPLSPRRVHIYILVPTFLIGDNSNFMNILIASPGLGTSLLRLLDPSSWLFTRNLIPVTISVIYGIWSNTLCFV